MLRIIFHVNMKVHELTPLELKGLDWDSVHEGEMETMPEEFVLQCPEYTQITHARPIDSLSPKGAWSVILASLDSMTHVSTFYSDLALAETITDWCTKEYIMSNIGLFRRLLNSNALPNAVLAIVKHGVFNINDIVVPYEAITEEVINSRGISQDERFQFLKDSNWLYLNTEENYISPVLLTCDRMKELKLPELHELYVDRDSSIIGYNLQDKIDCELKTISSKITWDDTVQMYYNEQISLETAIHIWNEFFNEFPHIMDYIRNTTYLKRSMSVSYTNTHFKGSQS